MERMKILIIMFDEKSLALSKEDFNLIKKISHLLKNKIFMFNEEENILVRFNKNQDLEFGVIFEEVELDGNDCYEITRLHYGLEPDFDYKGGASLLNKKANEVISEIYQDIDGFLFELSKGLNLESYNYYIRDKINDTFSTLTTKERAKIFEIESHNSFLMWIDY